MIHVLDNKEKIIATIGKGSQPGLATEGIGQDYEYAIKPNLEKQYWVTEIKPSHANTIKKGYSQNKFEGGRESISSFAKRTDAYMVFNASGPLSNGKSQGLQVKDGETYQIRNGGQRFYETLAVMNDGSLKIIDGYENADPDLTGVKHSFHFGPYMIKDGVKRITYPPISDYDYIIAQKHPRQGIGQKEDGTIVIITVDGRREGSLGMSIPEFADLFHQHNCIVAYNLDGGGSAQSWVDGGPLNYYADGVERELGDYMYYTSDIVEKKPYNAPVFWDDEHIERMEDHYESYEFRTQADSEINEYLKAKRKFIIRTHDGTYRPFIIDETSMENSGGLKSFYVYGVGEHIEIGDTTYVKPSKYVGATPESALSTILAGTRWRVGDIDYTFERTIEFEKYMDGLEALYYISSVFELTPQFRVEIGPHGVAGRFVDFIKPEDITNNKEFVVGKDVTRVVRKENTANVCTRLIGIGPQNDKGDFLTVESVNDGNIYIEDEKAYELYNLNGQHIYGFYEYSGDNEELTPQKLLNNTKIEFKKRIESAISYEVDAVDLERISGYDHEKVRKGDNVKIKDETVIPHIYVEARVIDIKRSYSSADRDGFVLGYFNELKPVKPDVIARLQKTLNTKLNKLVLASIGSSAGDVFKNGEGTTELSATVFLNGEEVDTDGSFYTYYWRKFDKRGIPVSGWNSTGKSITVTGDEIDGKATYAVDIILDTVMTIARLTISNVFDGEDGGQGVPGPPGENGETLYTWHKYADNIEGNGMSDSPDGKDYIGMAYNKESPNKSANPADYEWSLFRGSNGLPGPPGNDGQPRYTWSKYADDKDGNGMSDNPDGKRYVGFAYNKTTIVEGNNPADYTWTPLYDNVIVGGRNLIRNSKFIENNSNNGTQYPIITTKTSEYWRYEPRSDSSNPIVNMYNAINASVITDHDWQGNAITGSVLVRTSKSGVYARLRLMDTQNTDNDELAVVHVPLIKDQWTRLSVTAKNVSQNIKSNSVIRLMLGITNGTEGATNQMYVDMSGHYLDTVGWQLEKGNIATDHQNAPEDTDQAIEDVKEYATEVSEAAYLDAKQDAEAYLDANGLLKGRSYNGISITNEEGFMTARGDGLVRTVQNSTTGILIQRRASTSSPWIDVFFVDTNGKLHVINAEISGHLNGATGTFGDVTVTDGDFNLQDEETGIKYSAVPRRNLIKDHSFELMQSDGASLGPDSVLYNWLELLPNTIYADSPWVKSGSPKLSVPFVLDDNNALAPYGEHAVVVRNANYVSQFAYEGIGGGSLYTVSGFFKRQWNQAGGIPRIEIWHVRVGNRLSRIVNSTFDVVKNDYSLARHATTFTTPSNYAEGDSLEVIISGGNNNWVQCDGVQMVEGDRPSVYQPEDSIWEITKGNYRPISKQHLLWGGAMYPNASQVVPPAKPLLECVNGWILQWQAYTPGTGIVNSNFEYTHIPKSHVNNAGTGVRVLLGASAGAALSKYIYVTNATITGHAENTLAGANARALTGVYEY